MKKKMMIGLMLTVSLIMTGCIVTKDSSEVVEENYRTVEVIKIEKKTSDEALEYAGIVISDIEKNLSFKFAGRLEKIDVQEGDQVEKGQKLGSIDFQDALLQLDSFNAQVDASGKEVEKAREAYLFSQTQYESAKVLYEAGAVSKSSLDSNALTLEQAKLNYGIARENNNRLNSEKARLQDMIEDGTIYADQEGIIDSIRFEETEFISPGQPVFILRSNKQKIVIQVTGEDQRLIDSGQKINYVIDGIQSEGNIVFIDKASDLMTSTYRVEIAMEDTHFSNGAFAKVEIIVGQIEGIWIPIESIQSSTIDFVYVVEGGKSTKRSIEIHEIKGNEVRVEGLEPNEILITSGMKSLVEGMNVKYGESED